MYFGGLDVIIPECPLLENTLITTNFFAPSHIPPHGLKCRVINGSHLPSDVCRKQVRRISMFCVCGLQVPVSKRHGGQPVCRAAKFCGIRKATV